MTKMLIIFVIGLITGSISAQAKPNSGTFSRIYGGLTYVGDFGNVPGTQGTAAGIDLLYSSRIFDIGAAIKYRVKTNCVSLIQPKVVFNVRTAKQASLEPYFGANIHYDYYHYNCPLYTWARQGLGYGGQAGFYISGMEKLGLFFEAQIDAGNLSGQQVWMFGLNGGAYFSL